MKLGFDAKRIFHNYTGLGNYGRDIVRVLATHSPENQLVLYNIKPVSNGEFSQFGHIEVTYPNSWLWQRLRSLWRLYGIGSQIREARLDIYHGLSGELPIGLGKTGPCKVVTVHDLIFMSHPQFYSPVDRFIYTLKLKHAVRVADRIIAISKQTQRDLIHYLGVSPEKIQVVYQGCNDRFKKSVREADLVRVREKYSLPQEYIINVGTIQERKNVLTLIQAVEGTTYRLLLVGRPKAYYQKVMDYITSRNLQDQVQILTTVGSEELVALYRGASLFAYPSICEGFGIPIIEAMNCGIPVISSAGGCFPEAGGPETVYVDTNDVAKWREAISRLMEDPGERDRIAAAGIRYVRRFDDSEVARNLIKCYQALL